MTTMDADAQERLHHEYYDLLARKSKLQAFILTDDFENLLEIDRKDLREQLGHMNAYWLVVARRAARHCPQFAEDA